MTETSRSRFRPKDRILKTAEFVRCQKKGKRFASQRFVVLHFQKSTGPTRLGVVVSRKNGNAVVRNRWKRVIRDEFRQARELLPQGGDEVVILRKSVQGKPDRTARTELTSLFSRVSSR